MTSTPRQILLGLSLAVAVVYGVTLTFPFIAIDDAKHIWQNPYVMSLSLHNLWNFWQNTYYGLYVPLVYNVWSLLASVTQALGLTHPVTVIAAPFFHGLNVILHSVNTALLWLLVAHIFSLAQSETQEQEKIKLKATLCALLFALHPLQVESVAWVSGLKDTLSGSLALLSLVLYFYGNPLSINKKKLSLWPLPENKWANKLKNHWWLFYLAALCCKPAVLVLPVSLMLLHWTLQRQLPKKITLWAPLVVAFYIIWITKEAQPSSRLEFQLEIWQKPLIAFWSLGFYLIKFFGPVSLAPDYGMRPDLAFASTTFWLYAGLGILLSALALWQLRVRSWLGFGLSLFVLGLSPSLGLISFEFQNMSTVADRYMYLFPMLGLGIFITQLKPELWLRHQKFAIPGLALLLAGFTLPQVFHWQSNQQLFAHTIVVNPRSYLSLTNYGLTLFRENRYPEAAQYYEKALAVKPDYLAAVSNLGAVYFRQQKFNEAIEHYQKYLKQLPAAGPGSSATYADIYFNMGAAQANLGRGRDAIMSLEKAVQIYPDHFSAHFNLSRLLSLSGQKQKAQEHLLQAKRLEPNNPAVNEEYRRQQGM